MECPICFAAFDEEDHKPLNTFCCSKALCLFCIDQMILHASFCPWCKIRWTGRKLHAKFQSKTPTNYLDIITAAFKEEEEAVTLCPVSVLGSGDLQHEYLEQLSKLREETERGISRDEELARKIENEYRDALISQQSNVDNDYIVAQRLSELERHERQSTKAALNGTHDAYSTATDSNGNVIVRIEDESGDDDGNVGDSCKISSSSNNGAYGSNNDPEIMEAVEVSASKRRRLQSSVAINDKAPPKLSSARILVIDSEGSKSNSSSSSRISSSSGRNDHSSQSSRAGTADGTADDAPVPRQKFLDPFTVLTKPLSTSTFHCNAISQYGSGKLKAQSNPKKKRSSQSGHHASQVSTSCSSSVTDTSSGGASKVTQPSIYEFLKKDEQRASNQSSSSSSSSWDKENQRYTKSNISNRGDHMEYSKQAITTIDVDVPSSTRSLQYGDSMTLNTGIKNGKATAVGTAAAGAAAAAGGEQGYATRSNWRCKKCTFSNHALLTQCEICEFPRDDRDSSSNNSSSSSSSSNTIIGSDAEKKCEDKAIQIQVDG